MRTALPTLFGPPAPSYRCRDCDADLTGTRFPEYGQCHTCNRAEVTRQFLDQLDRWDAQLRPLDDHAKIEAWRQWVTHNWLRGE